MKGCSSSYTVDMKNVYELPYQLKASILLLLNGYHPISLSSCNEANTSCCLIKIKQVLPVRTIESIYPIYFTAIDVGRLSTFARSSCSPCNFYNWFTASTYIHTYTFQMDTRYVKVMVFVVKLHSRDHFMDSPYDLLSREIFTYRLRIE